MTSSRAESIGERLRRLRTERGLSQRQLATRGVSYAYISRIEAGARQPSVKALRVLAAKLGVTAEYLETGAELPASDRRELELSELELRLRLDGDVDVRELERVLADSVADADVPAATRARIALGLAASSRGEHQEAIAQLEAALAAGVVTPASRPDAYVTLGRSYAARGTPAQAVELFDRVLAELPADVPGNESLRTRFRTYLSFALTDAGDLQRAQAVVREALSEAQGTDDPYTRVRLYWSLGRLSIEQGKPYAALDSFRRAIALLEATEDSVHLARAHLNCAHALIDAGEQGDEASSHLELAEHLLGCRPADDDLAGVRLLQARLAAQSGDRDAAERYGNEGLVLAHDLPNEQGQIWWAIAEARASAGDPSADDAFRNALELLGEYGTVRERAHLLRRYGRYLRDQGREAEALDVLERAAEIATNLQAHDSASRL